MPMTRSQKKFLFDEEFASRAGGDLQIHDVPTRDDLRRAGEEAFAAGHASGRAEADAEIARTQAQALEAFSREFSTMKIAHESAYGAYAQEATRLAVAIGRKLAASLIEAQPLSEIEALVNACLRQVMGEARVVVRVHEAVLDSMQTAMEPLTSKLGFDGHVILLAEEGLAPGDCRVEWADGGAERDVAALSADIDQAIERLVSNSGVADATALPGLADDATQPA